MKMKAYRSISAQELKALVFSYNPIFGYKRWGTCNPDECSCTLPYGVVCFFLEPWYWEDKEHTIDIVCEFDTEAKSEMQVGKGTWHFSKSTKFSHVYKGRAGKYEHSIKELYVRSYCLRDVISINLRGHYAFHFLEKVKKVCGEYGIEVRNESLFK